MKNFIRVFCIITLALTVGTVIFFGVVKAPILFGIQPYVVLSGSMEPEIPTGSLVYTDTHDRDVEMGDIITYSTDMGKKTINVTHRVAALNEDGQIMTKGDANKTTDGYIEPSQVTGTVKVHIPYLGYAVARTDGMATVVIIAVLAAMNITAFLMKDTVDKREKSINMISASGE